MSKKVMKQALEVLENCQITFHEDEQIAEAVSALKEELLKQDGPDYEDGPDEDGFKGPRPWNNFSTFMSEAKKQRITHLCNHVATIKILQEGSIRTIDNIYHDCVNDWPIGEYKLYISLQGCKNYDEVTLAERDYYKSAYESLKSSLADFKQKLNSD